MPWQPLPKMQLQREVSQVRSQRKICSSSAGSGNSTQARAKSRPFSSGAEPFGDDTFGDEPFVPDCFVLDSLDFGAFDGLVADLASLSLLPRLSLLSALTFFVFGTVPG